MAPTGKIVQGDVLDVEKTQLERALQEYDPQVYLKWNPEKCKGWGCWELRRRPSEKTAILAGSHQGVQFYELDYLETDMANHVKDWAYLNYDILGWMKDRDVWKHKSFADYIEKREAENTARIKAEARAERAYAIKQHKTQIRALREKALSGTNLAEIAKHWDSGKL